MKKIVLLLTSLWALSLCSCFNLGGDVEQKNSDWLFLLYFDADSNLNDSLYVNLRQTEAGLAYARKADGSPEDGYPSINVVVLWDGISEELKGDSKFMHPDGAVFELGADYELRSQADNNQFDLGDKWKIGANTKDLTSAARGWLKTEPDMGDYKTLEGFLKWAKARYSAKNVVVCLDDHGAGTHKETYDDSTATSKSLCSDETNSALTKKDRLLTCKNIKDALKSAGYTGADKPKILWNDLCSQATAEIVYNFAGCADYFSASPNLSFSNNFMYLIGCLKSSYTARDFGKLISSIYYNMFYKYNQTHCTGNNAISSRSSGCSMITWSLFSLDESKAAALKTAVDNFAGALLEIKDSGQTVAGGSETLFNAVYSRYIKQNPKDLSDCKGLAYCGSFAFLNDLGWLTKEVLADDELSAAHCAAQTLQNLLKHGDDNLIVHAWGGKRAQGDNGVEWTNITANQMYHTNQPDLYSGEAVSVEFSEDIYGMTIAASRKWGFNKSGQLVPYPANMDTVKNYYDWTGFSQKWGQVINYWLEDDQ